MKAPRHKVTLSDGFWLFDTPVTQAFWQAVMGENPSRFVSATRPVEQVSFKDVETFLDQINERYPGLNLSLPTEAQWEYACRAGTEHATYRGPMKIKGDRTASILSSIAWYRGNAREGFELDNGWELDGHGKSGTHAVGQKQANAWGLYDMLGNVLEWCKDSPRDYDEREVEDPVGEKASGRVFRGGSWCDNARNVRAAYRDEYEPDNRNVYLGFRCLRVQERE